MLTTEKLMAMPAEKRATAILKEKIKCYRDPKYLIETYFSVDAGGKRIPFVLYPHQLDALDAYIKFPNNITMKTRQMGFTTFTAAFICCMIINNNAFKVLIISKEMNSSKDFVKTIKDILYHARLATRITDDDNSDSWLIPNYKEGYNNKESFYLENDSFVKAQGNTEDAGRGVSGLNLAVVDEVAFIDRKSPEKMSEIWAALGPALATVQGRTIMISTPFGSNGWYYDTYTNAKNMGFNVIDAHWTKHPIFNKGQYQWIFDDTHADGGYLKFYNETWPNTLFDREAGVYLEIPKESYGFIKDGKIRSPWYDFESKKLGPRKTACELDCTFVGTGGEVLDPNILREMKIHAESCEFKALDSSQGMMSFYREFKAPIPGRNYVVSADTATGDGSDYSSVTILDLDSLDICGSFKTQLLPKTFARVIYELAIRYNHAHVVIENAGGGGTTLQELKEMRYTNIYYSTLNKKDESIGVKKRKIGLWVSEEVRGKGGDQLEQYIRDKMITIPDDRYVEEFYNWIWDKDGRRRHAPGKHDDLIMSLQHAIYYHAYVYKRNKRNRSNFNNMFNVQKNGVDYYSPNGAGGMLFDANNFDMLQAKRNNGIDIIDNKKSFVKKKEDDGEQGGRFGMFI